MPANRAPRQAETTGPAQAPTLPLMHATLLLAGLGTFLLGPLLPLLSARWHLSDAHAGLLLLSQFIGATIGGVTMPARLLRGLLAGLLSAGLGLLAFALAGGLGVACPALLLTGFGVGRVITATNLIAGGRYAEHRSRALTQLNLSFSLGALLSPLLALALTPHVAPPALLFGFGALFLLASVVVLLETRGSAPEALGSIPAAAAEDQQGRAIFLFFAALILLYGGLETCFNSWLTTFATREARSTLTAGQGTLVLFLLGVNAGRALAGALLKRVAERVLQCAALASTLVLGAGLIAVHRPYLLAILAVLLGAALAPVFPVSFAMFLGSGPSARKAGVVLAGSGIGAALFGWVMGFVSTAAGSLRAALVVPVLLAAAMLALVLWDPVRRATATISPTRA